jgi:hypothetical protein
VGNDTYCRIEGKEEYPTNNNKEAKWIDHILRHVIEGNIEGGI